MAKDELEKKRRRTTQAMQRLRDSIDLEDADEEETSVVTMARALAEQAKRPKSNPPAVQGS